MSQAQLAIRRHGEMKVLVSVEMDLYHRTVEMMLIVVADLVMLDLLKLLELKSHGMTFSFGVDQLSQRWSCYLGNSSKQNVLQ